MRAKHSIPFRSVTNPLSLALFLAGLAFAGPVQWTSAVGGNDHWYDLTPELGSFAQLTSWAASSTYLGMPGYLVSIHSAAENQFLVETFGDVCCFTIGFTDEIQEGVWRWVSGEPTTYTNWRPGEPNNSNNEDYAIFNWRHASDPPGVPGGFWNDVPGGGGVGIVEYGPTVPEPTTPLLVAVGLAIVGTLSRRRGRIDRAKAMGMSYLGINKRRSGGLSVTSVGTKFEELT